MMRDYTFSKAFLIIENFCNFTLLLEVKVLMETLEIITSNNFLS